MINASQAQDIEVGPIRVDTGDDWLDFGFIIALIILAASVWIIIKRWTK